MRHPKQIIKLKKKLSHPHKSVEEYIPWGSTKVPSTRIPGQAQCLLPRDLPAKPIRLILNSPITQLSRQGWGHSPSEQREPNPENLSGRKEKQRRWG